MPGRYGWCWIMKRNTLPGGQQRRRSRRRSAARPHAHRLGFAIDNVDVERNRTVAEEAQDLADFEGTEADALERGIVSLSLQVKGKRPVSEPIRKDAEFGESVVIRLPAPIRRALPSDLPPRSTVWDYLDLWEWDGTIERIHHALYVQTREQAGRQASPTTAIIDAQSAKGAVKGGTRLIPAAMMRAKRSSGASVTSSSTR